jgi:hypothetical protein
MILKPTEIKYEKVITNITRFKKKLGSVVKKSIEKMKRFRKRQNSTVSNNEEPSVHEKWIFECDDKKVPVIACVNSKSGGRDGEEVLASFYKYLNPLQVDFFGEV